jgi:hypothetical protein
MDGSRFILWDRRKRVGILITISLVALAALCFVPRIPLGSSYHDFADKRAIWGIPNGLDVLSNLPFVFVGVWGTAWLFLKSTAATFTDPRERIPYLVFFAGAALTGAGSFWYHLSPGDSRLPWDLLPMTCSFMSIVVGLIMERINVRAGLSIFLPLLLFGMASVAYWYFTGDYRFYLFVQFFPPILLAAIILLFPPKYTHSDLLLVAFIFYVAAKLFEVYDSQIYAFGEFVSGHSLKHMSAALSCFLIFLVLKKRHVIGRTSEGSQVRFVEYKGKLI